MRNITKNSRKIANSAAVHIIALLLTKKKARQKKPWICRDCGGLIRWRGFIPCPRGAIGIAGGICLMCGCALVF